MTSLNAVILNWIVVIAIAIFAEMMIEGNLRNQRKNKKSRSRKIKIFL